VRILSPDRVSGVGRSLKALEHGDFGPLDRCTFTTKGEVPFRASSQRPVWNEAGEENLSDREGVYGGERLSGRFFLPVFLGSLPLRGSGAGKGTTLLSRGSGTHRDFLYYCGKSLGCTQKALCDCEYG